MESERHVGGEIHRLSHLFKRRLDDGMPQKTTGMQARIIGFLRFNEGRELFQRDVEAEFGIRRSTATGILQLMEDRCRMCSYQNPFSESALHQASRKWRRS